MKERWDHMTPEERRSSATECAAAVTLSPHPRSLRYERCR